MLYPLSYERSEARILPADRVAKSSRARGPGLSPHAGAGTQLRKPGRPQITAK
jgi:hypothetical protein